MSAQRIQNDVPFIGRFLKNSSIPDSIIDAYYALQPEQPRSLEQVPAGYAGYLHRYNEPYRVCIHGSYPLMIDWQWLQIKAAHKEYDNSTVDRYLKLFARGFKQGYSNFEIDIVNSKSTFFKDIQNRAQIIFDYASSMGNGRGNFPERFGTTKHIFSGWGESGKKAGYFYRAWYLILENHRMFQSLFSNSIKDVCDPSETIEQLVSNSLQPHPQNSQSVIAPHDNKINHRVQCLAYEFKMSAYPNEFAARTATELRTESERLYKVHLSLQKGTKNFRAATEEEIRNTIELLKQFPEAQTLAKNYLKDHF